MLKLDRIEDNGLNFYGRSTVNLGILKRLFSSNKSKEPKNLQEVAASPSTTAEAQEIVVSENEYVALGLAYKASDEEKELLSVITSAVMAGSNLDSRVEVKEVYVIDTDKEVAAIMATTAAAGDSPNSSYKIKSIIAV